MTGSERFAGWFCRFNGIEESLIEREGYFFYEARQVGTNWFAWMFLPVMAAASFAFSWFARGEPLAFWLGIVLGVIAAVVIPAMLWISARDEPYSWVKIENGVLSWESKAAFTREMEGQIDLSEYVGVEVEMDHEGVTSGITFTRENGKVAELPRSFATMVMSRCRKPFVKTIRFYRSEMFEELKALYNAKPQGCS